MLDWAPTFLTEAKGANLQEAGFQTAVFEIAGIIGALLAGSISDKVFRGRRGPVAVISMLLLLVCLIGLWQIPPGHPWMNAGLLVAIGFFVYGPRVISHTGKDFVDRTTPAFIAQRSRVGFNMGHKNGTGFAFQIQDSRLWGEEPSTLNDFRADGLDIHQAYAIIPLGDNLKFKMGRQEIVWDNARLVGNVGWVQRARSFDAARLSYKTKTMSVDAFYTKLAERDSYGDGHVAGNGYANDSDFGAVQFGYDGVENLHISVNALALHDKNKDVSRNTFGVYANGNAGAIGYTAEFYYQMGHVQQADDMGAIKDTELAAMMGALRLSYALEAAVKPKFIFWGEYLSGDGTPSKSFDTLFAANHKFYGEQDYFLGIPKHTGNNGLIDVGGRVILAKVMNRLKVNVDGHYFMTVNGVGDAKKTDLGTEVDLKLTYTYRPNIKFMMLYGVFMPGEAMRGLKGIWAGATLEMEQFSYFTTNVSF